ncbi:hypothetical protein [Thiolapillus sp.]
MQRGNRRQDVFFGKDDYEACLSLLKTWCGEEGIENDLPFDINALGIAGRNCHGVIPFGNGATITRKGCLVSASLCYPEHDVFCR